ncbi:outer membrane beta-barrel protein [Wenyingzhuangia sp. IMCC45533]
MMFLISNIIFAQITGKVKDAESSEALEYATVALYSSDSNKLITGVITSRDGKFVIDKVNAGTYYVEATFIGYETKRIENISIDKKSEFKDLGIISLSVASNQLEAVELRGTTKSVIHKIDRQVFDAKKYQVSKGGTATDIIKNLPSVTVNGQGDINVRGSNSFAVLINGKPTQGDATTILGQLPANAVQKVELITAPSAKYDPEGTAGILNIITKRGAANGDYAQVSVRGGFPSIEDYNTKEPAQRYGIDATYNTRTDKWNYSIGASFQRNDKTGLRDGNVEIIDEQNITNRLPSFGERSFDDVSYNARFSVDYTPNDQDEFSVGLFAGKRKKDRLADIFYTNSKLDANGVLIPKSGFNYYNHNLRTRKGDFALGSIDYTHKFKNESKLSTSFLYEYTFLGGPTENDNVDTPAYKIIYQQERNTNDNPLEGIRYNLDYTFKPTSIGVFEAGYQYRNLNHQGEFEYNRRTPPNTNFINVPEFSSNIELNREIHAAYLQLSGSKNKWDYAAGVRVESMDREYKERLDTFTRDSIYKYDFVKLFPSASVQYRLNDKTNLKAAYSKRVQRTTTFKMNSFAEREHSEVFEQGDNQLRPEFIDVLELGVTKNLPKGNSFYATAYYRHTKNVINRVNTLVYEEDADNPGNFVVNDSILNRVYSNVGKSNAIGLEVGATVKASKNWTNFVGANIYNYAIDGVFSFNHRDGIRRTYPIDTDAFVYSLNVNSTYNFWKNASLQFTFNYLSDRNTALGEDSRFYSPNLSFKKSFYNDQLTATLQWQNIDMGLLKTNEQRITTSRPNEFFTTTNYIYEVDMVTLNLTYTFNKLKNKSKFVESEFGKREF